MIVSELKETLKIYNENPQVAAITVVGTYLDNAFGNELESSLLGKGLQEVLVLINNYYASQETKYFNLCNLLALVKNYNRYYTGEHYTLYKHLRILLKDCRESVHEPDEQGLYVGIRTEKYKNDGFHHYFITLCKGEEHPLKLTFNILELMSIIDSII